MRKKSLIAAAVILISIILYNYTYIVTTILSKIQYKEQAIVAIKINADSQEKLGEIASAALDSISATKINSEEFYKGYKYLAVDADKLLEHSKNDKQYILTHFKKYNDRAIYANRADLRRLGLYNSLSKSYNGGMYLTIDKVVDLKKDKAILRISYYAGKAQGEGYICTLVYKNDKWEVQSTEIIYMS